jgi:hypothetical protein
MKKKEMEQFQNLRKELFKKESIGIEMKNKEINIKKLKGGFK